MTLMISEVYDALRSILSEEEARRSAIALSDPNASHEAIAATFREIGVPEKLAERAAKAVIEHRKHT
jgi:hypothetical protein